MALAIEPVGKIQSTLGGLSRQSATTTHDQRIQVKEGSGLCRSPRPARERRVLALALEGGLRPH